jgi:hypothetical protein
MATHTRTCHTHAHTRMEQSRLSGEVCALGVGHDTLQRIGGVNSHSHSNKQQGPKQPPPPPLPPLTECRMPGDASTMPLLAQLQLAPSIHRPYTMQPSSGATSSSRGLPATYADANSSVLIATLYLRA